MDSPTAMNFTENQQASAILDKIRMQKDKGRFCDVIFQLKDQEYLAHRNVLAACSPYFDSMLKMNKVAKEHITINCTDHKVFEMLLDYVYTGKIIIDLNIVAELLKLSNQFMISKLKAYCSEYLERNLYPGNCFWTKELAERCGLQTLGKTAEAYMLANIIEVIEQNEVLEFPVGRMEAFLSNKSLPLVEELKVHLINRWTRRYLDERVSKYQLLLSFILWDKVNMYSVCKMLAEDPLFASSEWCMYSILQTLQDSVHVLSEGYTDTLRHLKEKLAAMEPNQLVHLAVSTAIGELKDHTLEHGDEEKVNADVTPSEKTVSSPMGDAACNNNTLTCGPTETKMEKKENDSEDAMNGNYEAMDEDSDTDDYDAEDEAFARSLQIDQSIDDEDEKTDTQMTPRDAETKDDKVDEDRKDSMQALREKYDGRAKHKRKGIPVKVRIQKSKIKMEMRVPKKRGRPPRLSCKKPIKTEHTKLSEPSAEASAKVESPQSDDAERENTNCDDDDDIDDKDEQFEDDNDQDYSPSDGDAPNGESKEKKRGRKRKLHEKFSCPKCFYVTMSTAKLDHHLEHAHRDDTTYACSVCTFKSMWNREYYLHMKEHFPGPPFECDNEDCDYSADRIQPLLYHRMVHTNERPYECTVCNMRFRTKNNLTTHLRCHTGEKPFKCIICERCFATKGTLEQHSVTHSDHRPYLCDTCGFNTKYQSHLIAHKRIHTGDVFHCQYTNCKYMTPKRSQLACHMRSHMSIRSHICSMCGRAFVEKSHLVRHERIHLDDKPFKCGECEYSSTRRDKLKEHALKYHSPESSVKVPFKPRKPRRQSFSPNAFPGMSQEQAEAQMQQGLITIQPTTLDQGNVTGSLAPYSHYTLTNLSGASQYVQSGANRTVAPPNYSYLLNTTCGSTGTTNMAIEPSIASYENSNISNSSSAVVSSPMTMMSHQIPPQHMLTPGRGCIDAISNVAAAAAAACVSMGGVSTVDSRGLGLMMDPHSLPTMVPHMLQSTMMTQHHHQRPPLDMNAQQRGIPPVGYPAPQPSPHPSHPSTPQPPSVHPQQLSSPPPSQQLSTQQPQQQQQQQPQQDFTGLHAFMGMYL